MTRRRVRRSHVMRWALTGWAVIIMAALGITVLHVLGWLIVTAAISAGTYALGRRHAGTRPLTGKLGRNAAYGQRSAAQGYTGGSLPRQPVTDMDAVSAYPAELTSRRARANGWTAPSRSILLSAECAAGECVWCHDARCQHDCGHVSRDRAPVTRAPFPDQPPF